MGFTERGDLLDTPVVIDPAQHRALGVQLLDYAERRNLGRTEQLDLLAMVGLIESA